MNCLPLLCTLAIAWAASTSSAQRAKAPYLPSPEDCYTAVRLVPGLESRRLQDNSPKDNPTTDAGATFGRVLFYNRQLSYNRRISCGTCHVQAHGFADGRAQSKGRKRTQRNSPQLANLAFHTGDRFFWDERTKTLETMVLEPIANPVEMNLPIAKAVRRLNEDPRMRELNERAFGRLAITKTHVARALAQFLRAMTSFRSRFDIGHGARQNLRDPFPNFTAAENRGKAIFFGFHDQNTAQSCASCHVQTGHQAAWGDHRAAPSPMVLQTTSPENNGLQRRIADPGSGKGAFRAPSLRNITVTGPYMHDGSLRTLEEVVAFYAGGVQWSDHLDPRLKWAPPPGGHWGHWGSNSSISRPRPSLRTPGSLYAQLQPHRTGIPLNQDQRLALVAFLKTLTDEEFLTDPRFSDPFCKEERSRAGRQLASATVSSYPTSEMSFRAAARPAPASGMCGGCGSPSSLPWEIENK